MSNHTRMDDRIAMGLNTFFWCYMVPAAVLGFVVAACVSQDFRESWFGPDYYTRSTPAYHGQPSRWWWKNPLNW